MVETYEQYLEKKKSISMEKMAMLHREMVEELGEEEEALELYEELIKTATKYIEIRANWHLWEKAQRREQSPVRTACHNQLILCMDTLAKYLRMQGKKSEWRDALGYEEDDKYNRKVIGDFACYLAFINGINAR